jgi:ATP phosphoribosyltransferase regulatory subunit
MSSAWQLPEDIADMLPAQASHIETLRRQWLDLAASFGYELVVPPMVEYLESLLSGTGHSLELQTFKLVDQLTGRTMGLRADTTPQVARIDAHLLNREGVTRLCYCGPVVHTRAEGPMATREPLQFGAEVYGHAGVQADLEVIELALDGLQASGIDQVVVDLGDARVVQALLADVPDARRALSIIETVVAKDLVALDTQTQGMPHATRGALTTLTDLYGDASVLERAERELPSTPLLRQALEDLRWLGRRIQQSHPLARVSYDLADHSGYTHYTGVRYAVHATGASTAIVRGGRYDEVGAVFGRTRPAAGFSLDLKVLAGLAPQATVASAIVAPWADSESDSHGLREAVRALRARGETVLCVMPGHVNESARFHADRELAKQGGRWVVQPRALELIRS